MISYYFNRLYLVVVAVLIFSCKTEVGELFQSTELHVIILNDLDVPLSGASAYLFKDSTGFLKAAENGDYSNAIDSLYSDKNGELVFGELSSDVRYYIYAISKDDSRQLALNNAFTTNYINQYLPKQSNTSITIRLEASNASVVFWSPVFNDQNLPIRIYLDGDSIDLENTRSSSPLLPTDEHTAYFSKNPGSYLYYIKGSKGCLWTGNLAVTKGDLLIKEISTCENAALTIWTKDVPETDFPLTLILDNKDTIGTLSQVLFIEPLDCGASGALTAWRPPGKYSYKVLNADKSCTWSGQVILSANDCKKIEIELCQ